MRPFRFTPALLTVLAFALLFASRPRAQVTVDLNALDQLKKTAPGTAAPATAKPAHPKPRPKPAASAAPPSTPANQPAAAVPPAAAAGASAATPGAKAPPGFHAPLPDLPGTPPPHVALAPLQPPTPSNNKPSSPPPAVLPDAAGTGRAFPGGVRITFGSGQGELSPPSEQSLRKLVGEAPKNETISYNVLAYAPGTAEDPSTARRLSLARGLAVRSVLMDAGVPSTRIYIRALGATSGSATPNRVDVSVLGANAPPPDLALPPPEEPEPAPAPAKPEPAPARPVASDKAAPTPGATKAP